MKRREELEIYDKEGPESRIGIRDILRSDKVQAVIGLAIFVGMILVLNQLAKDVTQAHQYYGLALLFLAIYFWTLTPISYMFTAFLLISSSVLVGILRPEEAFTGFASSSIFFLIGAFILASTVEKHGLHKRIALRVLRRFGESPDRFLLGLILITSFLSMMMPGNGVAALFIPVLLSIFSVYEKKEIDPNFVKSTLLALTFSTSIGSMGTYLGGARNILAVEIYHSETNQYISFVEWFIAAIPIVIIMTFVLYFVLKNLFKVKDVDMQKIRFELREEVDEIGSFSMGEAKALGFLISAIVAWVIVGQYIGLAVISVLITVFIAISKTISWDEIVQRLPWGAIFLFGGAVSLSFILGESGTLEFIATSILKLGAENPLYLLILFTILTLTLANLMSSSAATGVVLPIALSAMIVLGYSDVLPVFLVAFPSAFAFMLVVGRPSSALVYSTGNVKQKDFFIAGLILNIIGLIVFLTIGLGWWRFLGYW
ncbi:MAG: SLC13 family permease [Candidatus Saliniplasma sp.]